MAISKEKKAESLAELAELFGASRMSVFAAYSGLSVKELQELRKAAKADGTTIKVAKNRIVRLAVTAVEPLAQTDTSGLHGQLLYGFNAQDEVAAAQLFDRFGRTHPALVMEGAIAADGSVLSKEQIKLLASLPSKDQLRAQVVGTIAAPLSSFVSVLSGNLRGIINVLNARSQQTET